MKSKLFHTSYTADDAVDQLSLALFDQLKLVSTHKEIVILCIGTDRSTGDALGPLIGTKLRLHVFPSIHLYGHLDEPIHAINLQETIAHIEMRHPNAFIIAIDACLGKLKNVGMISLIEGALRPGAGVHKDLPSVGDLHITGIVNVGGFMEYLVLQSTRLSLVMRLADIIAEAVIKSISNYLIHNELSVHYEERTYETLFHRKTQQTSSNEVIR